MVGAGLMIPPNNTPEVTPDTRDAPWNLVVACLTAAYGVMMLVVWTTWSGL